MATNNRILGSSSGKNKYQFQAEQALNNNPDEALEFGLKALEKARLNDNLLATVEAFSIIGRCYMVKEAYTEALDYFNKALALAESLPEAEYLGAMYADMAVASRSVSEHEQSIEYARKGLTILEKYEGTTYHRAICQNMIGHALVQQGALNEAIEAYRKGLKSLNGTDYLWYAGNFNGSIGEALLKMDLYDQALHYFKDALILFRKEKHLPGMALTAIRLGEVYKNQGQFRIAIDYYHEALKIADEFDNKKFMGQAFSGLGQVKARQKQYTEAEVLLNMGQKILNEVQHMQEEIYAYIALGELHLDQNQTDLAITNLEKALDLATAKKLKPEQQSIYAKLALAYNLKGNKAQADTYHRKAASFK